MVKAVSQPPNLDDIGKFTVSGAAGDFVYKEGDTGKELFIIQEGRIEIQKPAASETQRPTVLGPGDFFGELALFEDQRRDTSAKGITQYRLLRIDRTTLDQLVQENPEIAVRMLYRLASRLREHEEALRRASEIAASFLKAPPPPPEPVAPPAPPPAAPPGPPAGSGGRSPVRSSGVRAPAVASGVRAPVTGSGVRAVNRPDPAPAAEGARERTRARKPSPVRARLIHAESGTEFTLEPKTVVGRYDRATGFTPEIDLSDLDTKRTLSRRHASITREADGWRLSEPKPTGNGTFVNDARVGAGASVKLRDGYRVRFGLVETVFHEG